MSGAVFCLGDCGVEHGVVGCYQTCRSCRQWRRNHLQGFPENIFQIVSCLSSGSGEAAVAAGSGWDDRLRGQGMSQVLEGVLGGHHSSQALCKGKHSPWQSWAGVPHHPSASSSQPKVSPGCLFTQHLPGHEAGRQQS